jgi:hypothetical protein
LVDQNLLKYEKIHHLLLKYLYLLVIMLMLVMMLEFVDHQIFLNYFVLNFHHVNDQDVDKIELLVHDIVVDSKSESNKLQNAFNLHEISLL